jgi:hypothetical protein
MALVIEDGSNVSGAEAYADAAALDAWALKVWGAALTGDDDAKEAAIRRAVAWLDAQAWVGTRANGRDQSLAWPRKNAIDADLYKIGETEIPNELITGQHILARAELTSPGVLSPDVTLSGNKVLTEVKGIVWTPQSAPNTVEAARPVITMAMDAIKGLLVNGGRTGSRLLERV